MALISLGTSPIHYFNKSAVSESVNLNSFTLKGAPFNVYNTCQHACVSPGGKYLAVSNSGLAATSMDLINWNTYELEYRTRQFMKVTHNNQFVAVGFERDQNQTETARIWSSGDAFDGFSWSALTFQNTSPSVFRDITTYQDDILMVVGGSSHSKPATSLLCLGTSTSTWQYYDLPAQLQGGLYSVLYNFNLNRVWVGGLGWIATADWQGVNTQWVRTNLIDSAIPVQNIQFINEQVICTARDRIFVSNNLFDYKSVQVPGHSFSAQTFYNNQIILGTHSLLTEYTAFVLDPDTLTVNGLNTLVSANAFLVT